MMMRKGKTPQDRWINVYKAHYGPVNDIRRNPTFVKNFLTVGDSSIKIFSADCKDYYRVTTYAYHYADSATGTQANSPIFLVFARI